MKARATTVILGLLLFLHFHCGGTSGDTFAPNGVSTGGAGLAQATNGSEVNTSKGVSIEGSVTVPTSSVANITIGTDAAQSVTISKNIVSDMPSDEGEICCKRYDGVVVANGGVDALGEIVGTVVPPASLDTTGQVICEVELEDGRTLLNHYDLTNKAEGDRVRVDVSADSTAAAEQVLSECGSATFKNMEACAYLLKREDFNPRRAFEKHRDKMESDSYGKPEEPLDQTISEEDAEKFLEIILQSPYGQDKTRDASEQGNLGRPVMGDPYGKVKDFDIQGKEHGRPFRAEPEIVLEAPLNPWGGFSVMSSGWDGAVTPQTLGGVRYQSFAKSSHWSYHPDPNIAGFRVYEKDPGELTFRVTREIFLANVTWHSSTYGRDGSTSFYVGDDGALVQVSAVFSGGIRAATDWPVGTYEAYVVAFDAEGKEGPRSVTCYATNLGEMQWLRPTEGQIIGTYYPKLEWSNIWPAEIRENGGWGWTELIVSDAASIYNHFHGYVVWPNTSQNVWRHLMSGHSYYAVLSGGGYAQINGVWHYYLAYSRLVGFSAQ